jgi:hypothetical protein
VVLTFVADRVSSAVALAVVAAFAVMALIGFALIRKPD